MLRSAFSISFSMPKLLKIGSSSVYRNRSWRRSGNRDSVYSMHRSYSAAESTTRRVTSLVMRSRKMRKIRCRSFCPMVGPWTVDLLADLLQAGALASLLDLSRGAHVPLGRHLHQVPPRQRHVRGHAGT